MKEENSNRTKILKCRLTPKEHQNLLTKCQNTTCRDLSDFVRYCIFDKRIIQTYRNRSLDDFMAEMSLLRTELNRIGNNFNQSVKRLHTLHQITEFRTWTVTYELEKKTLSNKMDEIKNQIKIIAESWLQESHPQK